MEWLLKLGILYFSFSIFTLASAWFASVTLKPLCPKWWQRHICAPDPYELPMTALRLEVRGEERPREISRRQLLPKL